MKKVLLHSCCAPCSAAILEWLCNEGYDTTIFFCNPNIYPYEEYVKRKSEIERYAAQLNVPIVDGDEDWEDAHALWLKRAAPLSDEQERGKRCKICFEIRLTAAAHYACENGFDLFTTSLVSSRWKDIDQIFEAGRLAAILFGGKVEFWEKNWRKGGLNERRNILSKQFYNQKYCGCEFSSLTLQKLNRNRY